MAYKKVGWKDYPSTDTPINATNLDHMDAGILENAQTIGDKTKISGIGDGTVAGAIAANNLSLNNCLKSVSDGKSTVASAITAQGVSTAADAEFATMATNIASAGNARYNSGYSKGVTDADNRVNSNSTNYKTGYNAGYGAGASAGGSGKYRVATGTTTVNFPAGEWSSVYIPTGLSSVAGGSCGFQKGNEGFSTESFSGSGGYLVVRARGCGRQGVTARWTAYGS